MLKSIELIGFKSFAKKGKLDFKNSITAIVGPNGSGKSNTAEAFRFVLGEQGGKAMRVKKGVDLIWGGSRAIPSASRAGVKIVLDNSANKLGVDFSEVVIERTVLTDGTHEYFINGSKVRLKDIQDLLANANIGSSGHHIISQGQADRILLASPKERREMLEDALGLKSYILRKAEAERKLSAVGANLSQAQSSERELLPKLKYLKKQAQAVEEAKIISKELEIKFSHYGFIEQAEVERELTKLTKDIKPVKEELQQIDANISSLREQLSESQRQVTDNDDRTELEVLEARVVKAQRSFDDTKQELSKIIGQIELLNSMQKAITQKPEIVPREAVRAVLLRVNEDLDNALEQSDIRQILAFINTAREKANKFIHKVLDAGEETSNEQQEKSQEQNLRELQRRRESLESKLSKLHKDLDIAQTDLLNKQTQESESRQDNTVLERDIYKEVARRNEVANILAELERKMFNIDQRKAQLTEDASEVEALLGKHIRFIKSDTVAVPSRQEIERLKLRKEATSGINYEVLDEYKEVQKEYDYLSAQIQDLSSAVHKLNELMSSLDKQAKERFTLGVEKINEQFADFFSILFGGGGAKLELEKAKDDDKLGVQVSVQLPRKKVTTLETLSGGERALASIALIFAMSQVNPPPFIILDETDAALDEANSVRYAQVVKRLSGKSQVILITHNRATMAVADTLYGITMGSDGVSQLLSVQLTDAQQYAK